ncbi:MAG TPA: LysR substrate-binding domain-containing protein, partial [Polyangia bacterium]
MSFAPHAASLRQLQYAVAVADARSFRRAAEQCGVSQPSLSAQLAQLEGALGVRLFERDRRRVLLTPAGEDLIERARRVLVDADDLVDAARRLGDPLAGTLAIGVIPTVSPYLLPTAAPAIRRAHPRLTVRWLEDKTENLARELHAGRLDAALLALEADLGGPLKREVIGRDPFVLAAPRAHPLGKPSRPASLSELRGAHLLLLDDGHCLRDQALAVCAGARTEELAFRATSLPTLAQMVSAGAGVTLLPRMAVPTESRRAHLAVRPLSDERAFRTLA